MYCLLGMCAYDDYDFDTESTIVAGLHFHKSGQNWETCLYAFDLNEGRQINIHLLKKPLEIHCCIIFTNQKYKEMSWSNTNKYSIYKSLKWKECAIQGEIQKLFFSILYEENIWKNDGYCFYNVFANVSPKRFIMHLFGNQNAKVLHLLKVYLKSKR
ncbi:hypothetical protein C2G38_2172611 [Gigaspora rosea]|uniref:Uncharacterized protein n=1 Tax=Gigaspora rosea TaxID=44941 RepID=A0A397VKE4_9GLOM|nr:hypothetical protein C2G38_2172611 [Gigaspora rosea]